MEALIANCGKETIQTVRIMLEIADFREVDDIQQGQSSEHSLKVTIEHAVPVIIA